MVSIIIPTYNRSKIIEKTINSCLEQTYPYVEILIIDDGSTDDTSSKIAQLSKKHNSESKYIKYLYQNNSGACVARNKGMDCAQGGYIQFMDSDDTMEPEKIEKQIQSLNNHVDASCAICDFKRVDVYGNILSTTRNGGDIHGYTSKFRSVSIMTPLLRKDSISPTLRWNPVLKRQQDMDFMFKYFLSIEKWCYVFGAYCNYLQHDIERISDTYNKGIQFQDLYKSFEGFYKKNKNSIPPSNFYILPKYRKEIVKRWIKFKIKKYLPEFVIPFLEAKYLQAIKWKGVKE